MAESIKCPVCGKEGIHDFRKEVVVCPCCGTDLGVYKQIDSIVHKQHNPIHHSKYIIGILSCALVLVTCISVYYHYNVPVTNNAEDVTKIAELQQQVKTLSDSITILNSQLLTSKSQESALDNIYIVRRGDSFCKISKLLYGTENRHKEIAILNNLSERQCIHLGDTLKVPNK